MKYINSVNGNHRFDRNGTVIMGWTVVGNETVCVSLDHWEGDWLRFNGKFNSSLESLQQFLIDKQDEIDEWIPKAIIYAKKRREAKYLERLRKESRRQELIDKDRRLKLYRSARLSKGKHKIAILTQPYEVGIYICISDSKISSLIQTGAPSHRTTNRKIDKIIAQFNGYKVQTEKQTIEYPLTK